jgi:hypothetical protein
VLDMTMAAGLGVPCICLQVQSPCQSCGCGFLITRAVSGHGGTVSTVMVPKMTPVELECCVIAL